MFCCKCKHLVFQRTETKAAFYYDSLTVHGAISTLTATLMQMCVAPQCSAEFNTTYKVFSKQVTLAQAVCCG